MTEKKKSDLSKAFRRYIFNSVEKFTEAMVQLDFLRHRNAKESAEREGAFLSAQNIQLIDYLRKLW